nr:YgjV family protein [uncultured Desulfobulbus sp.]
MSSFVLSQILVAVAIGFDLLSFQFKHRRRIIACLCCSCLLIAIHFCLLGLWTAMGLALLAAVRMVASYFTTSKAVMLLFVAASLVVAVTTYQGLLSLLSCLGAVFGTIGSFCREDRQLRLVMMGATSLWLIHNILAGTPTAVLMEALFLGSNFLGFYRFYGRRAGKANPL